MGALGLAPRIPGGAITPSSIARAQAATGMTDAQMRAAVGSAASLAAGLQAIMLMPPPPTGERQPPPGFTFVTTSLGADFVTIGADRVIARAS